MGDCGRYAQAHDCTRAGDSLRNLPSYSSRHPFSPSRSTGTPLARDRAIPLYITHQSSRRRLLPPVRDLASGTLSSVERFSLSLLCGLLFPLVFTIEYQPSGIIHVHPRGGSSRRLTPAIAVANPRPPRTTIDSIDASPVPGSVVPGLFAPTSPAPEPVLPPPGLTGGLGSVSGSTGGTGSGSGP